MQIMNNRSLSFPRISAALVAGALAMAPALVAAQPDGDGMPTEMVEDGAVGGLEDTTTAEEANDSGAVNAQATPMDGGGVSVGTWGLGGIVTASGIAGVELEYHLASVMVSAVLGFGFYSPDGGDTETDLSLAGGVFYPLRKTDNAAFSIGGRLGIIRGTNSLGMATFTQTTIAVEVPLRAEWWVSPNFSLHLEAGAALRFNSTDPDGGGSTEFDIGTGNLTGAAGFTVFF